jgi:thymidylate kinase
LTLIFDLPVESSMARVRPKFTLFPDDPKAGLDLDRIEQRSWEYHEQVRKHYLDQVKRDPKRHAIINSDRAIEPVFQDVLNAAAALK